MPDPATLVVLRMLVPQIPQLLVVTAKHSLGMSSTSGKTDLQTVITVRTLRTFYSKEKKSQPISQLQAGMMQERGVRGNMWVATSTIPRPPNSDQDVGEELDLRNAVFEAVDSLSRSSEQTSTTYIKPGLEDLEVEWVGYRAKPGKETLTEAEKYDRLMNEPSRTTDVTILYFHGGGWYMCDPRTHRGLASRIAKECHGRVCLPRFRLAPQTGFPGQLLDALQVYLSLIYPPPGSMHAAVPARNIILAGESSGGNIAFSLVQLILQLQRSSANGVATIRFHGRKVEVPLPGGVSANSPTLDWSCSLPSRTQKETYPWDYLPAGKHDDCISHFPEEKGVWPTSQPRGDIYCDLALLDHPLVSPVVAQSWEGAPPMWISIGEERLQDENISLAKRAAQQGVKVTFDRYQAMPHAHTLCLPNTAWEKQCMRRWGQWAIDTVAQRTATKSIGTWIPSQAALGKKKHGNECIQFNVAEMESLDFDEVLKLTSEGKLRRMAGFEELKIKLPYLRHAVS